MEYPHESAKVLRNKRFLQKILMIMVNKRILLSEYDMKIDAGILIFRILCVDYKIIVST